MMLGKKMTLTVSVITEIFPLFLFYLYHCLYPCKTRSFHLL